MAGDESGRALEKAREVWDAMSPGWERRRAFLLQFSAGVQEWMLRELDPQPGETILELAAGTGDLGFEAASALGEDGRIITTDLSPGMVEVAMRRAAELGLRNADVRVADATNTGLDDDSVDGILCRWGFMLMPDPPAAFAESRRVLRPDGRLVLSVMGNPAGSGWATVITRALVALEMMPAVDPNAPGGLFSLADEEKLEALLRAAGFDSVRTEEMTFHLPFPDFEDYWTFILEFAGAAAVFVRGFPQEKRERARAEAERIAEEYRSGSGYDFPGVTVNAVAS